MIKQAIALIDLDAMLHIVASIQFKAGNLDNREIVKQHISRFIYTVQQNSNCNSAYMFYQKAGHTNFRNTLLPEYKGHRTPSDAILQWKETILEAFEESGAIGLQHIESDDAISILANKLGAGIVTIVSSDKDMLQVSGLHYNPYKSTKDESSRWQFATPFEATRFFWEQVLTGDSTDMPNDKCGIQGVGPAKASAMCDDNRTYAKTIQEEYSKKYGADGFKRANLTYMMVRLLTLENNAYINKDAEKEVKLLLDTYESKSIKIKDAVADLFEPQQCLPPSFLTP